MDPDQFINASLPAITAYEDACNELLHDIDHEAKDSPVDPGGIDVFLDPVFYDTVYSIYIASSGEFYWRSHFGPLKLTQLRDRALH